MVPSAHAVAAPSDLDSSFGGDGRVTTDFAGMDFVGDLAIQADGKVVAVGSAGSSFSSRDFAVARYTSSGDLDDTFSGDGLVVTDLPGTSFASAVEVQSDGKIVAAGSGGGAAVVRYNENGSLDSTFSGDGMQATASLDDGRALAIQADGMIVIAGGASEDFALARFDTGGTLDPSFSGDGVQTTDFGALAFARGIAIQSDQELSLWVPPTTISRWRGTTPTAPSIAIFPPTGCRRRTSQVRAPQGTWRSSRTEQSSPLVAPASTSPSRGTSQVDRSTTASQPMECKPLISVAQMVRPPSKSGQMVVCLPQAKHPCRRTWPLRNTPRVDHSIPLSPEMDWSP